MVERKQRHGCLSAWLILALIINSIMVLVYLFGSESSLKQVYPDASESTFTLLAFLGIINLICTVALFNWKKWGFLGFILTSIAALILNLSIGLGIGQSLFGLVGILILYAVLQIGKENKGWTQLE